MILSRALSVTICLATVIACDGTEPSNTPPVAAFTARCSQLACIFENGSTDKDGSIATYAWSFGDGGTSADASPVHSYAAPGGGFTVTVAVTDDDGAATTYSKQVTVRADSLPPGNLPPGNLPPVAAFSLSCTGLACSFTDQSTDPDAGDSVMSRVWNFGDGQTSTTPSPFHRYAAPGGQFTVTLAVTDTRGVTASTAKVTLVTPDGLPMHESQIAFLRDGKIYRVNTDGTGLIQLSAGPADSAPAWSPEGTRIAFRREGEAAGIYVMTADGANPVLLVSSGRSPTWSPDGQWIAFSCPGDAEYSNAICKVSTAANGSGPVMVVTTGEASALYPAWSPDGARIAFSSDWNLLEFWLDIWTVSPDGTQATALRTHRSAPDFSDDDLQPAWSPDGRRIAVVQCPHVWTYCDSGTIALMDADGSRRVSLAAAVGYAHPTWSPDGQTIAFASANAIEWVSADGSQRGRIIENGTSPAWRP
jgi:Tol biopolymer transport system component